MNFDERVQSRFDLAEIVVHVAQGMRRIAIVVEGMTLAMTLGIESPGKYLATKIKTQEQLDNVLLTMRQTGNKMPSMLRKGFKEAGTE